MSKKSCTFALKSVDCRVNKRQLYDCYIMWYVILLAINKINDYAIKEIAKCKS